MCTEGERQDRSRLIEEHLPLVRSVVLQVAVHFPRYVDRQELARAGTLGLVEAAQRWDEERGVPFDRFAARRIRGAILDSVRAADWAPRSVRTLARRLERMEQELSSATGRAPSDENLAAAVGVTIDELDRVRAQVARSVVLALESVTTASEDGSSILEMLADRTAVEPAEALERQELHGYLRDAVHLLPERQRAVVVGYFLENRTSLELAHELGVTESRISQLRSEGLTMLREGIEAQYDPLTVPSCGRAARRRARYAAAIRDASHWQGRLAPRTPTFPVLKAS